MKIILQDNRRFVLRFDKGEEVAEGLKRFFTEQNITACVFNGLGACSEVELGYYNKTLKDYRKKPFFNDWEIVSLTGNIGIMDVGPVVHMHGIFSDTDFAVFGGHVFKLVASVTCEIFLIKLDGLLERRNNPDFNLNLLI